MKPADMTIDWGYLRASLRRLLAATLAVAVIGGLLWYLTTASKQEHANWRQRLDTIRRDYETIMSTRSTMAEFYADFQTLQGKGIAGQESRLAWIELVEGIAGELMLPGVAITMQPQQRYAPDALPGARVAVKASPMHLDLKLLHEGDLLVMLEMLKKRAARLFLVRSCELKRKKIADTVEQLRKEGVIEARCELLWLTLAAQPGTGEEGGEEGGH